MNIWRIRTNNDELERIGNIIRRIFREVRFRIAYLHLKSEDLSM